MTFEGVKKNETWKGIEEIWSSAIASESDVKESGFVTHQA